MPITFTLIAAFYGAVGEFIRPSHALTNGLAGSLLQRAEIDFVSILQHQRITACRA